MALIRLFILAVVFLGMAQSASAQDTTIRVTKTAWTQQDESNFSKFIQALGRTKCNTVDKCIRSEANPYRGTDPAESPFYSDCADFPYFLRMYFAWKNGLPFAYATTPQPVVPPNARPEDFPADGKMDTRYAKWGNSFAGRRFLMPRSSESSFPEFFSEAQRLQDSISTAMFRHHPEMTAGVPTDFYSVEISKQAITPGTVIYDPNGHIVVVYEVLPDGKILYFAAHPDNSVSRGSFSNKMIRSKPDHGAGFRKFRPFQVVGAKKFSDGSLYGGKLEYLDNRNIPDFSTVQYFGLERDATAWQKGKFFANGKEVDFHSYVQMTMASEGFKMNPVADFESSLAELCDSVKQRVEAVNVAVTAGVHMTPHMDPLPRNIYGAEGLWESYSSPSRDVRLKMEYRDLIAKVRTYYARLQSGDSNIEYQGNGLKVDLIKAYQKVNYKCQLSYANSKGQPIPLTIENVNSRLYGLSFSPFHCPERRWGATGSELRTCTDDSNKERWYIAQQFLRDTLLRDPSQVMGWSLMDLENGAAPQSTEQRPDLNLKSFLEGLPN
ncbi:MAG: hypothetical protein AB7H97_05225 [Pseudobdellovibrionaceae bacterium]